MYTEIFPNSKKINQKSLSIFGKFHNIWKSPEQCLESKLYTSNSIDLIPG